MNLDNIRCFVTLAECLNFTRAAAKEHITQTTMSRKISALEKELDVVLLFRDTRQVELTAVGHEFHARAKELLRLYPETVDRVQDVQRNFTAELKIGVGVYDHTLLNRFLEGYVTELDGRVKLSCMQWPYATLASDFKDRLIDVMLSTEQFEPDLLQFNGGQLGAFTVNDEDWYLLLHYSNPLAQLERVPLSALATQTLISLHPTNSSLIQRSYRDVFTVKDVISSNSFDTKLVLANAGLGVAFAPPFVFPVAERYQNLVLRKTDPPYDLRKFRAYYWKDNKNPAVMDFVTKYREFCRRDGTTGP